MLLVSNRTCLPEYSTLPGLDIDIFRQFSRESRLWSPKRYLIVSQLFPLIELELALVLIAGRV
jgi:hypothetical protein